MDEKFKSVGTSEQEAGIHRKYAMQSRESIVEIGVLNGDTTRIILLSQGATPVYDIDPIIPDSMNPDLKGSEEKIRCNTQFSKNFTFIKDYSYNIIKDWNKSIDYLFIDADHRYEAVKRDFEDWFPFVIPGGIISLHDSAANRGGPFWWPGPSQLADELINDDRVSYIETIYCLTVFRKNK